MIIGITGPAGSGKDTLGELILSQYPNKFVRISFADPIKYMLQVGLKVTGNDLCNKEHMLPEYGCSTRHLLQTLGTEWGRKLIHPDIWITCAQKHIDNLSTVGFSSFVFTDVRFENEVRFIRTHAGTIIHLTGRGGIPGNHESESGVKQLPADWVFDNSGSIADLERQLIEFFVSKGMK